MSKATVIGIHIFFIFIFADLAVVSTGAIIKATTAGRIPLKIRSTIGLSYDLEKNIAISSIRIKDGRTVPKVEIIQPLSPLTLFPTMIEILTAKIPGKDWEIASASRNSSLSSHL